MTPELCQEWLTKIGCDEIIANLEKSEFCEKFVNNDVEFVGMKSKSSNNANGLIRQFKPDTENHRDQTMIFSEGVFVEGVA